jgi:hypothetical protein
MRLLSLLAAVLALGLAGVTTSAAAGAAAHHGSLTSLTAARPAGHMDRGIGQKAAATYNSCSIGSGHFTEYGNNCGHPVKYSCQVGTIARFSYSPSYVSSGCPTRVIIYTGATLNGHHLCIAPHTATHRLRRTYRSFRIGSSHFC